MLQRSNHKQVFYRNLYGIIGIDQPSSGKMNVAKSLKCLLNILKTTNSSFLLKESFVCP